MIYGSSEILTYSAVIIAVLVIFAVAKRDKNEGLKLFLFWGIAIPIIFSTFYLAAATVWQNQTSVTKGPVHWHADYQIYVCGQPAQTRDEKATFLPRAQAHEGEEGEMLDLKDPRGLSNRIGTSDFHEHGDHRIHVEGVVEKLSDVSLGKFFEAIDGQFTPTFMRIPTNAGIAIIQNGMDCGDSHPGAWQVFVYKTRGQIVTQEKLQNYTDYVLSPYSTVPPGDCIIMEFSAENKDRTEKICPFYQIALDKGELKYAQ